MARYSFFVAVHLDRYEEFETVMRDLPVSITPYSADGMVILFYVSGEASLTRLLDRDLWKIRAWLASDLAHNPEEEDSVGSES